MHDQQQHCLNVGSGLATSFLPNNSPSVLLTLESRAWFFFVLGKKKKKDNLLIVTWLPALGTHILNCSAVLLLEMIEQNALIICD